MEQLIREPTATAQWCELVRMASFQSNIKLNVEVESYLVFMLMRHTNAIKSFSNAMSIDFLTASSNFSGSLKHLTLRDTADKCVLIAGLFPKFAERRRVKVSYFIDLAQGAYGQISSLFHSNHSEAWRGIENHVEDMVLLLSCTRLPDLDEQIVIAYRESLTQKLRLQ